MPTVWLISFLSSMSGLFVAAIMQNRRFDSMFLRWDALHYQNLMRSGYLHELPMLNGKIVANRNAFFPGFPAISRVFDEVLPGNEVASGLILNLAISLAVYFVFYKALELVCEKSKARMTMMLFAFFPGAYIFFWFYAETLAVFFIVCAFYYLLQKNIWYSAMFVGLATATRPNAVPFILMVPIFLIATNFSKDTVTKYKDLSLKILLTFSISISGFASFMLYLWQITKIKDVWFRIEREGWGESTAPFKRLGIIFSEIMSAEKPFNNLMLIIYALLGLGIAICGFLYVKKMNYSPLSLACYIPCLLVILLALSNNVSPASPRFYVMAAPIFLSFSAIIPSRYLKVSLPILLFLMSVSSAFFTFASNVA